MEGTSGVASVNASDLATIPFRQQVVSFENLFCETSSILVNLSHENSTPVNHRNAVLKKKLNPCKPYNPTTLKPNTNLRKGEI